jgi:hypothetical protein
MITYKYKHGYIHDNFTAGIVQVQIGYKVYRVKSVHAAKLFITAN